MTDENRAGWCPARLLLALIYFAVCALGHLQFSLWLVARRSGAGGAYAYQDALGPLLLAGLVVLVGWVLWQGWLMGRLAALLGLWTLWGAVLALWDRGLTYSLPEYLHHPQYAILAILLARALDPQRRCLMVGQVLLWTTLLGMLDELLQYLWITVSYSEYLDFNDFFTNLIGAMAGVLLYYGRPGTSAEARAPARWAWAVSLGLAVCVALGLGSGRMAVTPQAPVPQGGLGHGAQGEWVWYLQRTVPGRFDTWHAGPYRGRYWILGPLSGMGLLLGTGGLFAWAGRRGLVPGERASGKTPGPPGS